ncbi:MAG TPA: hypothetical protein VN861_07850 [Candidatus Acidoferrales bacterium]|nr:hypothetical protein [Candidatus Acidoferrales bacterium]
MATEPTIAVLNGACEAQESRATTFFSTVSDYWALTKPEVNFLILITLQVFTSLPRAVI